MIDRELLQILIIGAFVGAVAGYTGSLMLTKRMSLMGGALGHLTLPGITLALIYGFDISIGAVLFLAFGILIIWLLERRTKLPMEALTAVVFASSLAVAFLFLPEEDSYYALIGDISRISAWTVIISVIASVIVFFVLKKIYSKLILISISEDLAAVQGINIKKYNLMYLACIALTVALGVRIVGGLMTAALVAIPASTSKNLSKNLTQYSYGSLIAGCLSCILGIVAFNITGIAAGPLIIIASAILFLVSILIQK